MLSAASNEARDAVLVPIECLGQQHSKASDELRSIRSRVPLLGVSKFVLADCLSADNHTFLSSRPVLRKYELTRFTVRVYSVVRSRRGNMNTERWS